MAIHRHLRAPMDGHTLNSRKDLPIAHVDMGCFFFSKSQNVGQDGCGISWEQHAVLILVQNDKLDVSSSDENAEKIIRLPLRDFVENSVRFHHLSSPVLHRRPSPLNEFPSFDCVFVDSYSCPLHARFFWRFAIHVEVAEKAQNFRLLRNDKKEKISDAQLPIFMFGKALSVEG